MGMRKCTYCGKVNEDSVTDCAGCGLSLDDPPHVLPPGKIRLKISDIVAFIGLIIGAFGTFCGLGFGAQYFFYHRVGPGEMIGFVLLGECALTVFILGPPCAIIGIVKGRRLMGWTAFVLVIAPFPLAILLREVAVVLMGIQFD
jgi:hypothetical protein